MVGLGGDQRALIPPVGRDLHYARVLFEALWSRPSKQGRLFVDEHEKLYQRWLRLAKVIIRNNGGITPFGPLGDTDRVLDLLEIPDDRNSCYPSPRDLNDEELANLNRRGAISSEALEEIYVNLGRPLDQRDASGCESESWKIYDDASWFLVRWGNQPAYDANPNIKRKRSRRREIIVSYRREVATFCTRWRLKAWWAVPALVQHHFFRAQGSPTLDSTIPPMSMYALDSGEPAVLSVAIKLAGRTEEQFERDKSKAINLAETTVLQADGGLIRVVRSRFSREERAEWETSIDSSCVLLEWDGCRFLPLGVELPTMAKTKSLPHVTPADYLIDQCQQRLGRPLRYIEKRAVKSQVSKQIREYRTILRSEGWSTLGDFDFGLIANTIARLLLNPRLTWLRLSPTNETSIGKHQSRNFQSVQRACNNFAALANLDLPPRRRGRVRGSRNRFEPTHW